MWMGGFGGRRGRERGGGIRREVGGVCRGLGWILYYWRRRRRLMGKRLSFWGELVVVMVVGVERRIGEEKRR